MKFDFKVDLTTDNKVVNFYTRIAINLVLFLVFFGWLIPSLISGPGPSFIFGVIVLLLTPLLFYHLNKKEADKILEFYFPEWFKDEDNNQK